MTLAKNSYLRHWWYVRSSVTLYSYTNSIIIFPIFKITYVTPRMLWHLNKLFYFIVCICCRVLLYFVKPFFFLKTIFIGVLHKKYYFFWCSVVSKSLRNTEIRQCEFVSERQNSSFHISISFPRRIRKQINSWNHFEMKNVTVWVPEHSFKIICIICRRRLNLIKF